MDIIQNFQFLPFSIILFPVSRQIISSHWLLIYLYTVTTGSGEFFFMNTGYGCIQSRTRLPISSLSNQKTRVLFDTIR